MIAFDRQEALRYLGYRNTEPDAAVADSLARCAAELQAAVQPAPVSVIRNLIGSIFLLLQNRYFP